MRDFFYTAQQIGGVFAAGNPTLIRYFKLEGSAFVGPPDSGPYAHNGQGWSGFNASSPGLPAPGYLLNQHKPTAGACFQAGHGFTNLFSWNGKQTSNGVGGFIDEFQNQSWSLVFAGLKPHNMTVNRTWHGIGSGSDVGGTLQINTDGSITVTSNVANPQSSAAGVIKQYVPHLLIMSYDNVAHTITVYVGDWTGRWVTAINAAAGAAISTSAPFPLVGRSRSGSVAADGFLDDYAVYIGKALSSAEALQLFNASGYADSTLSYQTSPGHRSAPFNRVYPAGQVLDADSAAAVTEFAGKANAAVINGAGSFNWNQFTTSIYVVSRSFRQNPANWTKITGPTNYGDQSAVMGFEDCPAPYSARPSLGFVPSNGSDAHACIWCPQTDEYWDMGVLTNSGTDLAPVWSCVYGDKVTGFSLFLGNFGFEGATATGIPNMLGVPTVAELQAAIYDGVPIPHGLSAVMFDGKVAHVWPAGRHDGANPALHVQEGQTYRLKHDAGTTAAIAAMPHPTGRAMAQAAQTYGIVIVDRNLFATLLQAEDYHQYLAVNGSQAYTADPAGKPALGGILNGQPFSVNTMSGFPWSNLELLDATKINPDDPSQPIQAAPTGLSGAQQGSTITMTWLDNPVASSWNVYQKTGPSTYVKIASTAWPQYTVWNPATSMTLAVTAVNGGGESSRSIDFTPPPPPRSRRRVRSLVG